MQPKSDSNQKLASQLIELSSDGFFAMDREYRFIYWSIAMERISGMPSEQVLGRNAFDVFPFFLETGEDRYFAEAMAGKSVLSPNRPFYVPESGKSGYFEARYYPLDGIEPGLAGIAGIVRDITEQRLAREILQETESRFENMADHSPVMLWMSGPDSLCNFFNQSWLSFTGRSLEQEWGVGWTEGVHPEDFQRCMDTYIAHFNERSPFEMEYRLRRADGEYRWILDRGVPRYTPQGIFGGYIGSCVDIAEMKKLELELKQAVRTRDDFLSIASHELKTPLSSLTLQLGMLSHLLERKSEFEKVQDRLTKATENARRQLGRLTELIEDLLSVSRITAGQLALERTRVELGAMVKETADRLRDNAYVAKSSIDIQAVEPVYGIWDQRKLDQVVTNLLTNALRYGPGKPIEISVQKSKSRAFLRVRDYGMGIPAEKHTRVFEKFQRGLTSSHYGGLGLGLYISRTIIDRHGGRIWVESEEGKGATFVVELPAE
jgi:PAS domain S-box-containing protein